MVNRSIANRGARSGSNRGLTLIELLVAISVLAIVAVLGWRGLDSIVRARVALTADLEQTRGMQLTFAQMQSDCAHLASAAVLQNRLPLVAEADRLKLVRTVFADNQPTRLQVVSYRLKDGVLTRRESAATRDLRELDMLFRTAADDPATSDTGTSPDVALQASVASMTMRLWISGSTRWLSGAEATQQMSSASATTNPPLLTGLEVSLKIQGRDTSLLKVFLLGAI